MVWTIWRTYLDECIRYPDSPIGRSREFSDSVHKTFNSQWENKESTRAGWLLLASLGTMTKEKSELSDIIEWLQMCINSLMVSQCALEENLLFRSHRARFQPLRGSAVKVRALVDKELDPALGMEMHERILLRIWTLRFSRAHLTWRSSLSTLSRECNHIPDPFNKILSAFA